MLDYAYTIFGLIGATICFISVYFIWRIHGRPWSSLFLISWLFMYNIFSTVDSIVWSGPDITNSPNGVVYCDVNSRIKTAFPLGVLGSTIGVCLFLVDSTDPSLLRIGQTKSRVRWNIRDIILGIVLPLLFTILKFIVEPSRYVILGVLGCRGTYDASWPSIPLYFIWPLVYTLIAFAFIGMFPRG